QADQAAIDSARLQLTYSRVTAPIGGTAGLRQVDAGNVVHAAGAHRIVVTAQLQPIGVVFPVPEDNLPRIRRRIATGEAVTVEAWGRGHNGKVAAGPLLTLATPI